jgi:hypothetical protein
MTIMLPRRNVVTRPLHSKPPVLNSPWEPGSYRVGYIGSRNAFVSLKKARLLVEFLAQPLGKLFHLFQSCVHVFGEEALPELLQI